MRRIPVWPLMVTSALITTGCSPQGAEREAALTATQGGPKTFAQLVASVESGQKAQSSPDSAASIQNTGQPVYAQQYPWQVAIRVGYGQGWRCGGVLISANYVLTAAHCLDGARASDFTSIVRIGHNDLAVFQGGDRFGEGVKLTLDPAWPATFHPKWKATGQPYAYDAALLKLSTPATASAFAPARSAAFGQGSAVTSGWGDFDTSHTPSTYLRAVRLPVVSNDVCRDQLPAALAGNVNVSTLCAVSRSDDSCARDSGGPLVIGSAQAPQTIGLVSWGPSGACGVPNSKGVLVGAYTRISEVAEWIRTVTADASTVTSSWAAPVFEIKPRNDI